jgi:hypothetical protein
VDVCVDDTRDEEQTTSLDPRCRGHVSPNSLQRSDDSERIARRGAGPETSPGMLRQSRDLRSASRAFQRPIRRGLAFGLTSVSAADQARSLELLPHEPTSRKRIAQVRHHSHTGHLDALAVDSWVFNSSSSEVMSAAVGVARDRLLVRRHKMTISGDDLTVDDGRLCKVARPLEEKCRHWVVLS